ncbi:Threonine/homoserine efflux transporter RhtA [Oceanospirillum multiglobuliferum]|nr:DMT family transporter [Oceanospirillum multiglobuliferum]SJZ75327.1 Threonine/homoserine efflux transporter RhtA [Oceanospirillum multiglobuliferum]
MRPSQTTMSQSTQADLLLVLTTLLAGAGWIFSKEALQGLSPVLFLGIRFSLAALVLVLLGYQSLRRLNQLELKQAATVGSVFAVAMVCWILGLHYASHVGVGAFLTSLGVVLVPLVSWLFGERPSITLWLSLPVVLAGLACLSLDSHFSFGWGEVFFLIAAVLFALFFVLNSRYAAKIPTLPLTAVQLVITGLVSFVLSFFLEDWQLQQPPMIWLWVVASAFIATSMRFYLQTRAQGMAPASHTAIIMTLEPIWTALFAALWLSETMTLLQIAGCALIFTAMLVNRWKVIWSLLHKPKIAKPIGH